MKKFRFQLETLLKVTRMKKEKAEVAFAEAVRKLEEARAYQRRGSMITKNFLKRARVSRLGGS